MLRFEQLDLFRRVVGEAVSFPSLVELKLGKLTASPTAIPGRDARLEAQASEMLRALGASKLLPVIRIEWNPRLRTAAGRANFRAKVVSLNPRLRDHGEAEIERTLRHELAHFLAHARAGRRRISPHGPEWRQACHDLGIAEETRCHTLPFPSQTRARRFLYRCPRCEQDFARVRRPRRAVACLACCRRYNRGQYDKQFQLRLVRTLPSP